MIRFFNVSNEYFIAKSTNIFLKQFFSKFQKVFLPKILTDSFCLAAPFEELAVHFSLHQTDRTRAGWQFAVLRWRAAVWVCFSLYQGCGVGVEELESEGFSTWGVGVVENFNDSDSGQTFCSPIVTVCATNVRKRHTWQFKQLDASTRDDRGYSERRQRTNLHTFTQGPFQISSVPWAHHATYTLLMQPFGACITEISI